MTEKKEKAGMHVGFGHKVPSFLFFSFSWELKTTVLALHTFSVRRVEPLTSPR